jgi:hypothetical protein
MEDHGSLIGMLFEKTEHFTKTSAELYRLKAIDKSADIISTLTERLVILLFVTLFFLILNIGIALWIGQKLGSSYFGFFIVSGFYAVLSALFFAFGGKWIKEPLRNVIITQALK